VASLLRPGCPRSAAPERADADLTVYLDEALRALAAGFDTAALVPPSGGEDLAPHRPLAT